MSLIRWGEVGTGVMFKSPVLDPEKRAITRLHSVRAKIRSAFALHIA